MGRGGRYRPLPASRRRSLARLARPVVERKPRSRRARRARAMRPAPRALGSGSEPVPRPTGYRPRYRGPDRSSTAAENPARRACRPTDARSPVRPTDAGTVELPRRVPRRRSVVRRPRLGLRARRSRRADLRSRQPKPPGVFRRRRPSAPATVRSAACNLITSRLSGFNSARSVYRSASESTGSTRSGAGGSISHGRTRWSRSRSTAESGSRDGTPAA